MYFVEQEPLTSSVNVACFIGPFESFETAMAWKDANQPNREECNLYVRFLNIVAPSPTAGQLDASYVRRHSA